MTPSLSLKRLLSESKKAVITFHENPDGDALGSGLGLYHLLRSQGYDCTVISPNMPADYIRWLPGTEDLLMFDLNPDLSLNKISDCDIVFCLDFNDLSRCGGLAEPLSQSQKPLIRIDHHPNPKSFEDYSYSDDESAATAQLIYWLAKAMEWHNAMSKDAATCLYTGIMTDTGSFRFASVSPEIHEITAALLRTGIDHSLIHQTVYDTFTEQRLRFYGFCFSQRLETIPEKSAAIIWVTQQDLIDYQVQKGDTEGLVNYALGLQGVKVGVLVIDRGELVKLSFRSKGNNAVNTLAAESFNGGGHKNAAGGRSTMSLEETIKKLKGCLYEMVLD